MRGQDSYRQFPERAFKASRRAVGAVYTPRFLCVFFYIQVRLGEGYFLNPLIGSARRLWPRPQTVHRVHGDAKAGRPSCFGIEICVTGQRLTETEHQLEEL